MKQENLTAIFGGDVIRSRSNPTVVAFAKLAEKKYRDETETFLAEGEKLTAEALRWAEPFAVLVSEEACREGTTVLELAKQASGKGIRVMLLASSVFEKITTEKSPQGIIAVVRKPDAAKTDFAAWQEGKRLLMLDEIRDPGNLGTILRTAEAMGMEGVILCGCADPYQPKTVRAAMGTIFRLPLYLTSDGAECVCQLRRAERRVLCAALGEHTLTLGAYEVAESDCVVIGNEGHGISEAVLCAADACVRIPMEGQTESLNAAAAAACILWEYKRMR